jgi:hypothetical protein
MTDQRESDRVIRVIKSILQPQLPCRSTKLRTRCHLTSYVHLRLSSVHLCSKLPPSDVDLVFFDNRATSLPYLLLTARPCHSQAMVPGLPGGRGTSSTSI